MGCILCEDHRKCSAQVNVTQVKEVEKQSENKEESNKKELRVKPKKIKDSNSPPKRKRSKIMPTYASQISQDSETTGIKMTIKLCKPLSGESGIASASVVQFNQ